MAHFAKVVNGIVVNVIKAEPEFFETYIDSSPGEWIQTSYNTKAGIHVDPETREPDGGIALRKNYAGVGYTYDKERDAFYSPKPFPSWILNEETCIWEAPVTRPVVSGKKFYWDEETGTWLEYIPS